MISVIVSWVFILFCSFSLGAAFLQCVYKDSIPEDSFELYIISGLCICTVYAQFFSLFTKVGFLASVVLGLLVIVSIIYLVRSYYDFSSIIRCWNDIQTKKKIELGMAVVAVLLWTSLSPLHYDTYLYHAQAIHWIEEYGVVPGLGNLHFRLAYDSAFMCLQALFSFEWLSGQSLHTVNGFFTLVMLGKIIISSGRKAKVETSDILQIGMLLFVIYECVKVSSPNTDTIALLLTYYIIVKWIELCENHCTSIEAYALLCVLIVFATTVKVSVGVLILLVIYPAVYLVKDNNWKSISIYILQGVIVLVPYLIRNVIISGYILYPYEATGIKWLDWIMREDILKADREEITAWGRGNADISRNSEHIWQWFGDWYASINILWKVLFVLAAVSVIYIIIYSIRELMQKKFTLELFATIVIICCFIFWLFMAPLPRYGAIYMVMLPCFAIAFFMKCRGEKIATYKKYGSRLVNGCIAAGIALYLVSYAGYSAIYLKYFPKLMFQGDYEDKACVINNSLGIDFYTPVNGDQTGYSTFPSTPYGGMLEGIELRGEDICDGFRLK